MALDPAIQLLLEEMKKEYAAELPAKIEAVRAAAHAVLRTPSEAAQHEYYRLIHDLHGSAGTFGFENISAAAEDCETEWLSLKTVDRGSLAASQIGQLTERLCRLMGEAHHQTLR